MELARSRQKCFGGAKNGLKAKKITSGVTEIGEQPTGKSRKGQKSAENSRKWF